MDMVTENLPDREIDFDNDPIEPLLVGNKLSAVGTTLGADNGIGIAAAFALMDDETLEHGPLEAFITVDEETNMVSALF